MAGAKSLETPVIFILGIVVIFACQSAANNACTAGQLSEVCRMQTTIHQWACGKVPTFPTFNCSLNASYSVKRLVLTKTTVSVESLSVFAVLGQLERLILQQVTGISLNAILQLFPFVKVVSLLDTNLGPVLKVPIRNQLTELYGLQIHPRNPPLFILNLPHLRTLMVTVKNEKNYFFFANATLSELTYVSESSSSFSWGELAMRVDPLLRLTLRLEEVTTFPVYQRCPFPNIQYYNVKVKSAKLTRNIFFSTDPLANSSSAGISKPLQKLMELELAQFTVLESFELPLLPALSKITFSAFDGDVLNVQNLPENLTHLTYRDCSLATVSQQTLSGLSQLQLFEASNNRISFVFRNAFEHTPLLRVLNLAGNRINHVHFDTRKMKFLEILDMSRNSLITIPGRILLAPKLKNVYLTSNQIIYPGYSYLPTSSLVLINLNSNPINCSCSWYLFLATLPQRSHVLGKCEGTGESLSLVTADWCSAVKFKRPVRSLLAFSNDDSQSSANATSLPGIDENDIIKSLAKLRSAELPAIEDNVLKPDVGVGFTKIGRLLPGVENFYVHIHLLWPTYVLPKFSTDLTGLQSLCENQDSLIQNICGDFMPLVNQAVQRIEIYSEQLKEKLQNIQDFFRLSQTSPGGRSRRSSMVYDPEKLNTSSILESEKETYKVIIDDSDWSKEDRINRWVSTFVPFAGGNINAQIVGERSEVFKKAIRLLAARQDLMKEAHMELRKDLVLALRVIADTFNKTSLNIQTIHGLLNETTQEISVIFNGLQASMNIFQQKVKSIRFLSILTSRYLQLWSQQVTQFRIMNEEADSLLMAVHELKKGIISPVLVSPSRLQQIIRQAATSLNSWKNDYRLLFPSLSQFYYHSRAIFLPTTEGFMIQLSWPIYPRNGKSYDLFRVNSVHVPVTTSPVFDKAEANHDFTKVHLDRDFFGVSDTNFLELSDSDLRTCVVIENVYYCYGIFLELDRDSLTCLTSIYLNASISDINEKCDTEYYFEPFKPPPAIIDIGSQILVSGLNAPWRYQCVSDRMPMDIEGSSYAIVKRDSFCYCSISATNGHIPRRITGCNRTKAEAQPKLVISYVQNSLAFSNLYEVFNFTMTDQIRDLLEAPPLEQIPKFTIHNKVASAQLLNTFQGSVKLKSLANVIQKKGEKFEDDWNRIASEIAFVSWFKSTNWPKAVTFAGAIAGFISLCLVILLILQNHYRKGLIRSVMFASAPTLVKASSLSDICGVDELLVRIDQRSLMYITLSHLALILLVTMIIYCGKSLVSYCCREARILVPHPELKKHPKVELFLEIHSGRDRVLIYLMTIKAHISKLHFQGQLAPSSLILDNHAFYSVLRPNWVTGPCILALDEIEIELPRLIQVPLYKRKRLQNILKGVFSCAMIATDGLYLYRLGHKTHQVISDKTVNPYSALIRELRQRETEFQGLSPGGPVSLMQTVEVQPDQIDMGAQVTPSAPADRDIVEITIP